MLELSPFPGILQTPIDVFSERGEPVPLRSVQLVWAVLLSVAGRLALARATRKLVLQKCCAWPSSWPSRCGSSRWDSGCAAR